MVDLVYTANVSVDGYTEDRDGRIDWSSPDEEVFSFIRELERPAGTYLYGRRMYEAMLYWESAIPDEGYVREVIKALTLPYGRIVIFATGDALTEGRLFSVGVDRDGSVWAL